MGAHKHTQQIRNIRETTKEETKNIQDIQNYRENPIVSYVLYIFFVLFCIFLLFLQARVAQLSSIGFAEMFEKCPGKLPDVSAHFPGNLCSTPGELNSTTFNVIGRPEDANDSFEEPNPDAIEMVDIEEVDHSVIPNNDFVSTCSNFNNDFLWLPKLICWC